MENKPNFLMSLITGPGGLPDESALAFLILMIVHVTMTILASFLPQIHYDGVTFVSAAGGILCFYNASIRVRGNQ